MARETVAEQQALRACDRVFGNLDAGDYTVTETLEDGWENTTDLTQDVTVVAGETASLGGTQTYAAASGIPGNYAALGAIWLKQFREAIAPPRVARSRRFQISC